LAGEAAPEREGPMDLSGERRLAEVLGARRTAQRRKGAVVQGLLDWAAVRREWGKKRVEARKKQIPRPAKPSGTQNARCARNDKPRWRVQRELRAQWVQQQERRRVEVGVIQSADSLGAQKARIVRVRGWAGSGSRGYR
jgi:hypothetical protein